MPEGKMILTKKSVYRHLIKPLTEKNFDIELVFPAVNIPKNTFKNVTLSPSSGRI